MSGKQARWKREGEEREKSMMGEVGADSKRGGLEGEVITEEKR